jgi:hypothetical protein
MGIIVPRNTHAKCGTSLTVRTNEWMHEDLRSHCPPQSEGSVSIGTTGRSQASTGHGAVKWVMIHTYSTGRL